jgi:DNA end-binding protein Ku
VEAVNARSRQEGDIHFHQLHAKCHNRIHYEKVCPIHGKIDNDENVSGYEHSRGKYVEVEPEELDELRTEKEKALTIDTFIEPDQLDLFISMAGCTI